MMPATVIAERIEWRYSIRTLSARVAVRPVYLPPDGTRRRRRWRMPDSGSGRCGPQRRRSSRPLAIGSCAGETVVTVQSGTVLEREHVRELGSGLSQVVVIETPIEDVILTDEEGNGYRLVGTARGNFVTAADPEDEFALESGFFAFKANLIGQGGLFGSIDFMLRGQNGNELIRDRSSWHFA
jgi:hypothetical protein